jgi:predicted ferric reductase
MRCLAGPPILPEMTALDLSADAGLLAVFLATANICLGLLMAVRYRLWRSWPHRRLDLFALHDRTAYMLLASVLVHPVILLFSRNARWRLVDIALPAWSPVQPLANTLGAAGLYLLVVVVVTSYYRIELGRRRWKRLHYLAYGAAACVFVHGILADPRLEGAAIDPFDGEKLFVESCLLVTLLATAWAWRHRPR